VLYTLYLYKDEEDLICVDEIVAYLQEKIGRAEVCIRPPFFKYFLSEEKYAGVARKMAEARVKSLYQPTEVQPLPKEVEVEERWLRRGRRSILPYDGLKVMAVLRDLIPPEEKKMDCMHIVYTTILFGTYTDRYHARYMLCGFPDMISITGLVEAPARPREYYTFPKHVSGGEWLEYGDKRLTKVAKGCTLRCLFYHLLEEGECMNKNCILYNAHWQRELLSSAFLRGDLCPKHQRMLTLLKYKKIEKGKVPL